MTHGVRTANGLRAKGVLLPLAALQGGACIAASGIAFHFFIGVAKTWV
jgi:hypothetical protein